MHELKKKENIAIKYEVMFTKSLSSSRLWFPIILCRSLTSFNFECPAVMQHSDIPICQHLSYTHTHQSCEALLWNIHTLAPKPCCYCSCDLFVNHGHTANELPSVRERETKRDWEKAEVRRKQYDNITVCFPYDEQGPRVCNVKVGISG